MSAENKTATWRVPGGVAWRTTDRAGAIIAEGVEQTDALAQKKAEKAKGGAVAGTAAAEAEQDPAPAESEPEPESEPEAEASSTPRRRRRQ